MLENKPAVSIAGKPGADERDRKVGCVHQVLHEGVDRACAASCVSLSTFGPVKQVSWLCTSGAPSRGVQSLQILGVGICTLVLIKQVNCCAHQELHEWVYKA